jgi:aminopeptidase-like protein
MANNELSGPTVMAELAKYIQSKKKLRFSYRFVLLPETIGSICYINKFYKILKKKIICGFNISCVGDNGNYSLIESRFGNTLADFSLRQIIEKKKKFKRYSFLERGSDERQYCSPGVNLPICGFSRTKYGEYKQYHTNLDNLQFISNKGLNSSFKTLKKIIDSFENKKSWYLFPKNKFNCEPNLGKRNLHYTISEKKNYDKLKLRMDLLAYADGEKNLAQISKIINEPIKNILKELKILIKNNILEINYN